MIFSHLSVDYSFLLDIKAKIDSNINCDIEMQVVDKNDIERRLLFYWSRLFSKSIKAGKDYSKLEKTIAILITDYELESLKQIPKYQTKWQIREEEYRQVILTDVMELYIIELPKFIKYKENKKKQVDLWLKFIENPEVIDMSNKEIVMAKKVLDEISQDEHERYLAEIREKYILDQNATEAAGYDKGLKEGHKKGIEEGIKEGHEKGVEEGKKEIAKKMLEEKLDIELIEKITNISKEELKKMQEK